MCGVPGQSRASWASTLERAVETGAEHVSVYPLTLEEGTALQVATDTGLVEEVEPDTAAEHLVLGESALRFYGFERYEVANYARSVGARARHNVAYWTGSSYVGVGPGAHGMVDAQTARRSNLFGEVPPNVARVRYANTRDIGEWLVGTSESLEMLDVSEAAREDAMLGMRMADGISDELARRAGVTDVLESLVSDGLVRHDPGRWRTTERGWLLGNEVFGRLWNAR